ncbi:MAG: DUF1207 domain-containing protein [Thermoguttaceae bacterium]
MRNRERVTRKKLRDKDTLFWIIVMVVCIIFSLLRFEQIEGATNTGTWNPDLNMSPYQENYPSAATYAYQGSSSAYQNNQEVSIQGAYYNQVEPFNQGTINPLSRNQSGTVQHEMAIASVIPVASHPSYANQNSYVDQQYNQQYVQPYNQQFSQQNNPQYIVNQPIIPAINENPICSTHQKIPITPGYPNFDRWNRYSTEPMSLQILPSGLIYPSYLAGPRESRLASVWNHERDHGWMWDAVAGGRAGILRYGTKSSISPEGFQLDVEGAGKVRIDYEHDLDLLAADFRAGIPLTFGSKKVQYKVGYYHVSSHLGDEYMVRHNTFQRVNYVRDSVVMGISLRMGNSVRLYCETAWAFFCGEKTKPWEFQFGAEYSSRYPVGQLRGSPYAAINAHLFQELDFSGNLNVQVGWQWRGANEHLFRLGFQYFCGSSDQFQFNDNYESKIGFGAWYDF